MTDERQDLQSDHNGYRAGTQHYRGYGIPGPNIPSCTTFSRNAGIGIVHLAEFHGVGHPKGPAPQQLQELKALFTQCRRLSDEHFLLLPGEEPNEFFGGRWLALFPKPVYWILSAVSPATLTEESQSVSPISASAAFVCSYFL